MVDVQYPTGGSTLWHTLQVAALTDDQVKLKEITK